MTSEQKLKTLIKNLQLGFHCPMKWNGDYQIISPFKDNAGDYRTSQWSGALEKAEQTISSLSGYAIKVLEERIADWQLLKPFKIAPEKSVAVGDMVLILMNNYDKGSVLMNSMVGKIFKVDEVANDDETVSVFNGEENYPLWFGKSDVCYPYESEQKDLSGKEVKVEIDGKKYVAVIK